MSKGRPRIQRKPEHDYKVIVEHDTRADVTNQIVMYSHCGKCLAEIPEGVTPAEWAQLSVGRTATGTVQVWCNRHNCNVDLWHLSVGRVQ